jgi:hypothetical protein
MIKESEIKKDLGKVNVKVKSDVYNQIKDYMTNSGYNVNNCDICSVVEDGNVIFFKFVHYSIPTMATEKYYRIEFAYE